MSEVQYQRLYQHILAAIKQGDFKDGRLPSERQLMERFDGTRITVREALKRLEQEGVVYGLNRRGWFISPPRLRYRPNHRSHFIQIAKAQGRSPQTQVLTYERQRLTADIAQHLLLEPNDHGHHIVRLRTLDGHPALYEKVWLNEDVTRHILTHDLSGSITELLKNQYNIHVQRVDLQVRVVPLSGEIAEHLMVRDGSVGLQIMQTRFDQHGKVFEYDCEYYRHDVIELDLSFHDL